MAVPDADQPPTGSAPLAPEPPAADDRPQIASLSPGAGSLAGSYGAVPNMIGDFFGGSASTSVISRTFSLSARGDVFQTELPGDPAALIAFEVGRDTVANDFFSVGSGLDAMAPSPDADTFDISEPESPTDAPLSPGPEFGFAGGTAINPRGTFDNGDFWDVVYSYKTEVVIPSSGGLVVGRMKIAENCSPLPRDRIFFNYSLFDNVPLARPGITVNRFSPGFEKTFLAENASIEVRTPFATTLDSDFVIERGYESAALEFGDLFLAFKGLLYAGRHAAVSAGVSLLLPTGEDMSIQLADGTPLVELENESVHIMPFLGGAWYTGGRGFAQGFIQLDVDASGDPVQLNQFGTGLVPAGRIQETGFLYVDIGAGYWLYRACPGDCRTVQGLAALFELHYSGSLQDNDVIRAGAFQIGEVQENVQLLNLVAGVSMDCGRRSSVTVGYAIPVGDTADQQFDGELRAFWNRWF